MVNGKALVLLTIFCMGIVCIAILPNSIAEQDGAGSTCYDETNDVFDNELGVQTSERSAYDIIDASIGFTVDSIELELHVTGVIDHDGFYIFQCVVPGDRDYVFSYSKLDFIGRDGSGGAVDIQGETTTNSIKVTIQSSLLPNGDRMVLFNVSAQSADLRFIDVLDCTGKPGKTYNKMIVHVKSSELVIMKFTTTFENSSYFKYSIDANKDGYVSLPESQDFAVSLENAQEDYIKNNLVSYYDSSLYVNGNRPWDITVYVDVHITESSVDLADSTKIVYDFILEYNDTGGGPFTLSIPINGSFLEDGYEESEFNLTIILSDPLEIEIGKTDKEIQPFVYENGTGLSIEREEIGKLKDRRYDVRIKGEEEDGGSAVIYIIIAVVSFFIAAIIFFVYSNHRYKASVKKEDEKDKKTDKGKDAKRPKRGKKGKIE
jgi:hypothetical protein